MSDSGGTITLDQALKLLFERYGYDRVHTPSNEVVVIDMPLDAGGIFIAVLSSEQAKYLALRPLRAETLKNGRLPRDWPKPSKNAT